MTTGIVEISAVTVVAVDQFPAMSLARTEKELLELSARVVGGSGGSGGDCSIVSKLVIVQIAGRRRPRQKAVVVAIRQPSEDKEFLAPGNGQRRNGRRSGIGSGGAGRTADETELLELEEADEDDLLAELDEPTDEDESAEEAGNNPEPPPPKPG